MEFINRKYIEFRYVEEFLLAFFISFRSFQRLNFVEKMTMVLLYN